MARHSTRTPGSLEERCAVQARLKLEQAAMLPLGAQRAQLEREAWELKNVSEMNDMLSLGDANPAA